MNAAMRGATRLAGDAAMDDHDAVRANRRRDFLLEIFERVAGLGENDDLAPQARDGVADDRIVEDRNQLTPLRILARLLQTERLVLQHLQVLDFGPQLVEVERGRRLVEDLLLGGLGFLARRFVDLVGVVARQVARAR